MPQRECKCVCACVCVAYFLFFFICATADRRWQGKQVRGEYLSEADLCCLEAQHFKPSLSCAHKYQNSSLCLVLPSPQFPCSLFQAPTTFTPRGYDWRIMQIYLAIALPFCCCPFATPLLLPPSLLSVGSKLLNCTELLLGPFVCSSSAYWMIFRRRDIE